MKDSLRADGLNDSITGHGTPETWFVLFLLFAAMLAGAVQPLSDPDLPMHLSVGEWIVSNRALPLIEPFAWSAEGRPYYAYSWLPQASYFTLMHLGGPAAVRLLSGAILAMSVGAMMLMGRELRWRPWTVIMLAVLHLLRGTGAGATRPLAVLLLAVPLAFALVQMAARRETAILPIIGLWATAALAANSHVFFPLTAVPLFWLLLRPTLKRSRFFLIAGAIVLGWLTSPYALHWGSIFTFVFTPTAIISYPSPISELTPGFVAAIAGFQSVPVIWALLLAFLPWGLIGLRLNTRQVVAAALMWTAGLFAFGFAVRMLLVWWLLALPMLGWLFDRFTGPATTRSKVAHQLALVALLVGFLAVQMREGLRERGYEGGLDTRTLPKHGDQLIEPLIAWLECHTTHAAPARVYTAFDVGSYITWRAPYLSASIDSRGTFPDSISRVEAYVLLRRGMPPLGPWDVADMAMLQVTHPVAAVLDTAQGWSRVAIANSSVPRQAGLALWVTEDWWTNTSTSALPVQPIVMQAPRVPPPQCRRPEPRPLAPGVRAIRF